MGVFFVEIKSRVGKTKSLLSYCGTVQTVTRESQAPSDKLDNTAKLVMKRRKLTRRWSWKLIRVGSIQFEIL